jgi:hypothetical protein
MTAIQMASAQPPPLASAQASLDGLAECRRRGQQYAFVQPTLAFSETNDAARAAAPKWRALQGGAAPSTTPDEDVSIPGLPPPLPKTERLPQAGGVFFLAPVAHASVQAGLLREASKQQGTDAPAGATTAVPR